MLTTPSETNQVIFQDARGHLYFLRWQECSKKCWPWLSRPRAIAEEDAERRGNQKKNVTPSCQILCVGLWQCVLPVLDVVQIHDWIHDWNCKFMTGGLILINKRRAGFTKSCSSRRRLCSRPWWIIDKNISNATMNV